MSIFEHFNAAYEVFVDQTGKEPTVLIISPSIERKLYAEAVKSFKIDICDKITGREYRGAKIIIDQLCPPDAFHFH